ncbi:hypothetical protein A3Q56_05835 [Intoshia linei]|uniref:Phosphorylase b kinase regulatory subunit n=1 Tax=Intoshia linei TaxID=1819745 RepID=A0A177AWP3_9BILA|nr:hypothetical protein A3Q56_05835 [Intoshia linei]
MNLSPYELKFLLYNILSVKEFSLQKYNEDDLTDTSKSDDFNSISNKVVYTEKWKWCMGYQYSNLVEIDNLSISDYSSNISISEMVNQKEDTKVKGCIDNRKCKNMWIRRRTYDASLNRIPVGFYDGVWHLLTLCDEIQFESKSLYKEIINEMTPCETQFALMVENVLSCIQKLEYKQLLIETVMMFMSIHKNSSKLLEKEIPRILNIDFFLVKANQFFMNDLIKKLVVDQKNNETEKISNCLDNKDKIDKCLQLDLYNISIYFYNLPPIGIYGSMNYITSAILTELTNEK